MIKLMHFIHGLSTGGAETLVKDYILNLDRDKFNVVLLCMTHKEGSPYERMLSDNGVRVIYVEDNLLFGGRRDVVSRLVKRFSRYLVIKKIIRKERPDILHIHLFLNRFVKFARPNKNMKLFYTVHNEPKFLWLKKDIGRQKDFRAAKWLVRHYSMRLIVLHDEMKKEIDKMFGVSNTIVLNNGIDLERFKNVSDSNAVRRKLNIPLDAFMIGHVGRFSEQKNHDYLVDVFWEIKKENKKAFLLMVGDGSNKKRISEELDKRGLRDNYLILSNRDDVADLMAVMDIFVFPSIFEGLGIVLIEAQESKLPCFVSDRVPEYATISNLVIRLSLKDGAKKWAEVILNYEKPKKIVVDDKDWDIKKITRQLEQIYLGALVEDKDGKK